MTRIGKPIERELAVRSALSPVAAADGFAAR